MVDLAEENLELRKQINNKHPHEEGDEDEGDYGEGSSNTTTTRNTGGGEGEGEGADESWVDVSARDVISSFLSLCFLYYYCLTSLPSPYISCKTTCGHDWKAQIRQRHKEIN